MTQQRQIQVKVCDRCDFTRHSAATEDRTMTVGGTHYKLDLCAHHAEMFDRDLGKWTVLAQEIDAPAARSQYFTDQVREETRRIRELKDKANHVAAVEEFAERRAAEIALEALEREWEERRRAIPGGEKWRLTRHARQRMIEREVSVDEVLHTAAWPTHVLRQPWRGPGGAVYFGANCRIAVDDRTHAVLTVIDPSVSDVALENPPREKAGAK